MSRFCRLHFFCALLFTLRGAVALPLPFITSPTETLKVLITGYEPFHSHSVNPAEEVAIGLNGTCHTVLVNNQQTSVCFEGWAIPVSTTGASLVASALKDTPNAWDGILHLGLENIAKGLKLETMAMNIRSTESRGWNADIPCNLKDTGLEPIDPAAPCLLATTAPLNFMNIPDILQPHELSEVWSRDAGAYYCNEVLFRTLAVVRDSGARGLLTPVMFVHLPDPKKYPVDEMKEMVRNIAVAMVGPLL